MKFLEKLKLILSKLWDFLEPFVKIFLSDAGKALASASMEAVIVVRDTFGDADGDTKRKEAFKLIVEKLKAKGIELSTSMINSAIEAAVQRLKDND